MTTTIKISLFVLAAIILVGIGFTIDQIGNVGIRTDGTPQVMSFSVSNPTVLGVPFFIRWQGYEVLNNRSVEARLVVPGATVDLGRTSLYTGQLRVTLPCSISSSTGRLELLDVVREGVLVSTSLDLLPPGPDCVQ